MPATDAENVRLTSVIVSSYVANNSITSERMPDLITSIHSALTKLSSCEPEPIDLNPAVPIKKSVTPDYIVCLEDGKQFKALKRHIRAEYGLTPDEYRAKWGLPRDYPMVAPNYSKQRTQLAKDAGLGQRRRG